MGRRRLATLDGGGRAAQPRPMASLLTNAAEYTVSEIAKAVQSPDVKARLATLGNEAVGSTPAEAEKYIAAEAERWSKLLKAANIRAD